MTIFDKFKLDNQVAIVTGGATGLGKAMAEGLAQAGANLVIADINLDTAQSTAQYFTETTQNEAIACQVDVASASDVAKMIDVVMVVIYCTI